MIYLIGGSPRCGKTTIAKKLSEKLRISWISSDTLESVASVYIAKKDMARLFPKGIMRKKTNLSNDKMYTTYTTKQICNAYIKQSKTIWKAIQMMVEVNKKEDHDVIIEGYHIHPQLIAKLQKLYPRSIKPVVLTRFDIDGIVEGCKKHKAKNDWFIQKTTDEKIYYRIAQMIKCYSGFFQKEAEKYKIAVVNVDGDFNKQIQKAIKYLNN